jgi:TolB protein
MARVFLIALASLIVAVPLAAGAREAFPGKPGKLVFQSKRDGNYELYLANANGSGVKKFLSRPQTDEFNANWSPSGSQIVFQTGPKDGTNFDIWIAKANAKGAKSLVAGTKNDLAPQFCDETTIVFSRRVSATNSEIYAVGADGRGLRQLTSHPASDSFPTCNAKGNRIAFITNRDGAPRIYEMTRTGSGQRAIADGVDPEYSPDGKTLAYVAPDADRNLEVFRKALATGAIDQVTNVKPPFEYRLPKYTPDGDLVVTRRNTQQAEETIEKIARSGTSPLIEAGSGGVFGVIAPCECKALSARVVNASLQVGEREGSQRPIVRFEMRWGMTCSRGTGNCRGWFTVSGDPFFAYHLTIEDFVRSADCRGPCGRNSTGTERFLGVGKPIDLKYLRSRFELDTLCGTQVTKRKTYELVFSKTGKLDRVRSDLDADGQADG